MQASVGFLSFGHPEGFGLPLAEAAACGCALIGYDGLGGRELMDCAKRHDVGWPVPVGDWLGFINGVHALHQQLDHSPAKLAQGLQALSDEIRSTYSMPSFVQSLKEVLPRIESKLKDL